MSLNNATDSTPLVGDTDAVHEAELQKDKKKVKCKFIAFFLFIVIGVIVCVFLALAAEEEEWTGLLIRYELKDSTLHCMDGTQPGYYLRTNSSTNNWIIFLEYGGAYCWDQETCDSRLSSDFDACTSSLDPPNKTEDGFCSTDPVKNPYMYNWNMLTIPYCSSDYWTGSSTPETSGTTYYFQGSLILESAIREVMGQGLLDDAEKILIAGQGAGGVGVLTQGDLIKSWLSELDTDVDIRGVMDTAWMANVTEHYLENPTCQTSSNCPPDMGIRWAQDTWRPRLSPRCDGLSWECYMAGISNIGDIELPLFIFEWQYEVSQLSAEGINFIDSSNEWYATALAEQRREELQRLPAGSGWLYPECNDHEIWTKEYGTVRGLIYEFNLAVCLDLWFKTPEQPKRLGDDCNEGGDWNCNPTCGAELSSSP